MVRDIYSISYSMRRQLYSSIFTILTAVISCILFISVVTAFFIFPVNSRSDSMSPDIPESSIVLVTPLAKKPERGDIMLVSSTARDELSKSQACVNWCVRFFTAQQINPFGTKNRISPSLRRVVGLPGDTLKIKNYIVYIKPRDGAQFLTEFELTKTNYNISIPVTPDYIDRELGAMGDMDEIVLKDNQYFLLGDVRSQCIDSRIWGPVEKNSFDGKALLIYFPFSKIRLF